MKHIPVIVAAVLVLYTLLPSTPETQPPAASGPVSKALSNATSSDKAYISDIYKSLADVITRDAGTRVTTTSVWRDIHRDTLALAVESTAIKGKYPGLDTAIEEVMSKHFSLENRPIDAELASKIADACTEVSRQCQN
tara:strand:- start:476 stop:889 length:414 start_codon:yes stop_codon:yes gene_type:complete